MNRMEFSELLSINDDIINNINKEIYIWGTGNTSALYINGLNRLKNEFEISGYTDNNKEKWGTIFNGKPVVSPNELKDRENICLLICSVQESVIVAVKEQTKDFKGRVFTIDEVIFKLNKEQVLECYDLLEDEESKQIYADLICCKILTKEPDVTVTKPQYFCIRPTQFVNPKEVFVDCGAFVGDSIENYIFAKDGIFKKIIAFEPGKESFAAMEKRCTRLKEEWNLSDDKICLYPYGVGETASYSSFEKNNDNNGSGSKFIPNTTDQENICKIVSLDEFLHEPYTFLKADIESYEYAMLLGAQNSIKEYRPVLAICIYHNAVDFFSIPLLIHSIVPEYKMVIRHHSFSLAETVLYAYI